MKVALALALLATAPVLASAGQVHKWVDGSGTTVYSQTPPPGGTIPSLVVAPPPPPARDPAAARQELDETIQRLDKAEEARSTGGQATPGTVDKTNREAIDRYNCEEARKHLAALESGPPRKILVGPDGKATRMSYDELQAEITETRKFIEETCKGI